MGVWHFCLFFLLLMTLTHGDSGAVYDAQTCGLPGSEFPKQRVRRLSPKVTPAQSKDDTADNEKKSMDYSDDYVLDPNSTQIKDINDPMDRKILGGRDALMGEFPWSVFIEIDDRSCGGTLVSKRHVITAAHCFWKIMTNEKCSIDDMYPIKSVVAKVRVMVGGICRKVDKSVECTANQLGTRMRVKSAYYDGFFEASCSGTKDIAFLELEKNVPYGVHHACLPHLHNIDEMDQFTTRLFSSGWGIDPQRGYVWSATPKLQHIDLGLRMTVEECKEKSPSKFPDLFCTVEQPEKNVCQGDSGGGVTASFKGRHYLVGVISRGTPCVDLIQGRAPGAQAHTDIAFYTAAIDRMMNMTIIDRHAEWQKMNAKLTSRPNKT